MYWQKVLMFILLSQSTVFTYSPEFIKMSFVAVFMEEANYFILRFIFHICDGWFIVNEFLETHVDPIRMFFCLEAGIYKRNA